MPVSVLARRAKPCSRASTSGGSVPAGRSRMAASSSSISGIPEATISAAPPLTAAKLLLIGFTKLWDSMVAAASISIRNSTAPKNHAPRAPRS